MKEIARDTINWVEDEEWGYEVPRYMYRYRKI